MLDGTHHGEFRDWLDSVVHTKVIITWRLDGMVHFKVNNPVVGYAVPASRRKIMPRLDGVVPIEVNVLSLRIGVLAG